MNQAMKKAYSRMERYKAARLALEMYFSCLKAKEFISYNFGKKEIKNSIIVITFDDAVDTSNIKIPRFLASERIKATFFVPPRLVRTRILAELSKMGHELAGHGFRHIKDERTEEYKESAKKCMSMLKKYDPDIVSWRFPWLSYSKKCVQNVRNAGFVVDSSVHCFYAQQRAGNLLTMKEIRFLRLPTPHGMDLESSSYRNIKEYILKKSRESGIIVLPFHVYEQAGHFGSFCALIKSLEANGAKFATLREACEMVD
jgi:peptidoglycan/xylan/chitin deacetylase (PgdA/CDA1 family)